VLKYLVNTITRPELALPRLLAALCGALMVVAYPKADQGLIAWFALIPLVIAVRGRSVRDGFWLGWLAGFVFFLGSVYWLWHVTVAGWVLLAVYLAVYFGLWGMAVVVADRRFAESGVAGRLAMLLLLSAAWAGQEWLRAHVITGFPWNMLGASQHANSGVALGVAQIAEFTGVYGVSCLVCFFNLALLITVERFRRERGFGRQPHVEFLVAVALAALAWNYGVRVVLRYKPAGDPLSVALIQPNIPQEVKEAGLLEENAQAQLSRTRLQELTEQAIAQSQPQLILWPETATPGYLRWDAESIQIISNLVTRSQAHLMTGSMDAEGWEDPKTRRDYNAVFLARPNMKLQPPYWKKHLVVFGEYVPFERWLPFMRYVTPIPGSFVAGEEYVLQELTDPPAKIGPLICFEDTFPYLARNFVARGATLLVNVTNDAWFKDSAAALQHAANAVFRAIETRTPLVRCANNGLSGCVDPLGRVVDYIRGDAGQGIFVTGWKTFNVLVPWPEKRPLTFYVRYGDVFALACLGLTLLWAGAEVIAHNVGRTRQSNSGAR
jgi:apolipoprotein N-acyltransferase